MSIQAVAQEAKATEAQAAAIPLAIAVFTSTNPRTDTCYTSGATKAIQYFASQESQRINKQGGIGGRAVRIEFLDDLALEALIKLGDRLGGCFFVQRVDNRLALVGRQLFHDVR